MPAQRDRRSRNPDDARDNEGGRFAIAGLVYQAIGVAGLLAEAKLKLEPDGMAGTLSVTHEKYGQDAVIEGTEPTGTRFRELTQFKFSLGDVRPIQPKELFEIIHGFANSERVASQLGEVACRFRLVTNRPLSLKAEREAAAAKSGESTQYLDGHDDRRRILAVMKREQKTLGELKISVEEYGRRRGMFPAELNDGVQKLVGWLMENTGALGSLRVTRENLDERLTGSHKVREITCAALRDTMLEDLRQFRTRAGLPDRLVRRAVADEVQRAVQEFPIVVLVGQGGTGKSALLESVLGEFLESGPTAGYASAEFADRLACPWLDHVVQRWRNIPLCPDGSSSTALERLRRAQGTPNDCLVLLGLDGLDETPRLVATHRNQIEEILDLAADLSLSEPDQLPRLSVIVTCREAEELKKRWRGYDGHFDRVRELHIRDFGDYGVAYDELVDGARQLDRSVAERVLGALHASHRAAAGIPPGTAAAVAPQILLSLRHPLLWGCFSAEPELSQHTILDGNRDALDGLAEVYVRRFLDRAAHRREELDSRDDVRYLLEVVATGTNIDEQFGYREGWLRPACESGRFGELEAWRVYQEAASSGMIVDARRQWRWRHGFVWDFLSRGVAARRCEVDE